MKKLLPTLLLVLYSLSVVFAAPQPLQNPSKETSNKIDSLLVKAEKSINTLEFDRAVSQLNTALKLSESSKDKSAIAFSSNILARLYYIRGKYRRSLKQLKRAINIQIEIGDNKGLAYSYIQYSKIEIFRKNRAEANKYLDKADSLYQNLKGENKEGLGLIALNRGIATLNLDKNSTKALHHLSESSIYLKNSQNLYERCRLAYYKARAELQEGNLEESERQAKKALTIAKDNKFGGMVSYSNVVLSNIYDVKNKPRRALSYLQESKRIKDSIANIPTHSGRREANTRFNVDALKSSIKDLKRQNAEQERTLKVNKLTTILSMALITILSLLTLSLYKNNNLRARANELLRKKNAELIMSKDNAEKASSVKAQFLSTITHELRTPLYAVTGLTHLLLEESPTENQKEHLNSLKFSGEYLLSLINNILDLNKMEANKVEVMQTPFNLEQRISDVLIALKKSADDKNTTLHFTFDRTIPSELIGDPLKVSQIIINLIGNSIKFTEDGDIYVKIEKIKSEDNFIFLHFRIEDNGEGITKEKQQSIFENFTQGSTQINRKFGGTGLGLSIVKNLLGLLGSEIHLESEEGKGSKFTFDLKFELEQEIEEAVEEEVIDEEVSLSNNIMKNKRILIVEDNKINQMITRKILVKNDVICDVADNGTIAIEKVKNNPFDLILMDIHMPGISGIEATVEIRKFNKDIPIVALTAVTLDDNLDQFYLNGFNDIIPKPYKTEEFFNKINLHIYRAQKNSI